MKKIAVVVLLSTCSLVLSAQEILSGADIPPEGHASLQVNYTHLSRKFTINGITEKVSRDIAMAQVLFRPGFQWAFYGFAGFSDFPHTYAPTGDFVLFGGGLKYLLVAEVDIEQKNGKTISVKGGMDIDLQIRRLQGTGNTITKSFALTEFQSAINFGLRVFMFSGNLGFKFSTMHGSFSPDGGLEMEAKAKGLFSMFLGFNVYLCRSLSLVSEISFFTERSWGVGLRLGL
ncbi:MAG: hypothetical protein JXB26_02780 [Candidatus Aminicenantes bacterium]|nr:hypothetical protein [Candidatus Aminicenantes bacterium]